MLPFFQLLKKQLDNIRSDEDYLEIQTDLLINNSRIADGYDALILNNSHTAIRNRALAKILSENNLIYSFDKINNIASILLKGGKINLESDIFAICENNILSIESIRNDDINPVSIFIDTNGKYDFFGRHVSFNTIAASAENVHKSSKRSY